MHTRDGLALKRRLRLRNSRMAPPLKMPHHPHMHTATGARGVDDSLQAPPYRPGEQWTMRDTSTSSESYRARRSDGPQPGSHGTHGHPAAGPPAVAIAGLNKVYDSGHQALDDVHLDIERGEIFALLGPNGAGKTTLIGVVCGLVNATGGRVAIHGHDIARDWRAARSMLGLVPQELATDTFESVWATVSLSRGLFGKAPDPAHIEKVLRDLALWEKRDNAIITLSGGMKRRVLIAKALAHEPRVLFLDEPTAGVDVELRREMWDVVRSLRAGGVTVILTTHYIEEAEEMADRVGVIHGGRLVRVQAKDELMRELGRKQLRLQLQEPLQAVPRNLTRHGLELTADGRELVYTFATQGDRTGVTGLLHDLAAHGIRFHDLHTSQSSLEDIFVDLVRDKP
ncbi:MAG: ABC transporter ATP-binding protein [Halofilum sp. (in: g-proteobacteria)]